MAHERDDRDDKGKDSHKDGRELKPGTPDLRPRGADLLHGYTLF
jgi:hypothetical protein